MKVLHSKAFKTGTTFVRKSAVAQLAQQTIALRESLEQWIHGNDELPPYLATLLKELQEVIHEVARKRVERTAAMSLPKVPRQIVGIGQANKRETVIEVLKMLGRPTSPTIVTRIANVVYGVELVPTQFASMRKGDERAYRRGRRSKTFLVPALSATDFAARPRLIAISEWPLSTRLIGMYSERVNALSVIKTCIELQLVGKQVDLSEVIIPLARSFNLFLGTRHSVKEALQFIEQELDRVGKKDMEERTNAAQRLSRLPEAMQLFGAAIALDGGADLS